MLDIFLTKSATVQLLIPKIIKRIGRYPPPCIAVSNFEKEILTKNVQICSYISITLYYYHYILLFMQTINKNMKIFFLLALSMNQMRSNLVIISKKKKINILNLWEMIFVCFFNEKIVFWNFSHKLLEFYSMSFIFTLSHQKCIQSYLVLFFALLLCKPKICIKYWKHGSSSFSHIFNWVKFLNVQSPVRWQHII